MSIVDELLQEEQEQGTPEAEGQEAEEVNLDEEQGSAPPPKTGYTITEELAHEYHLPPFMIGKPVEELAKSYREAQKLISKGEHKKPKADAKVEEKVDDIMEDLPDPLDEPEKFRSALNKRLSDVATKAEERALKLIEERYSPYFKNIEDQAVSARQKQIASDIQEALGVNEAGMNEVLKAFVETNPNRVQRLKQAYADDPSLLVEDLQMFYVSQQYAETRRNIGKKATEQAINKIKGAQKPPTPPPVRAEYRRRPDGVISELLAEEMEQAKLEGRI